MSKIVSNDFSEYSFTEDEEQAACCFTSLQRQNIQNHISRISQEKIAHEPDPNEFDKFIQKEAYLRGQIDILKHLLEIDRFVTEHQEVDI